MEKNDLDLSRKHSENKEKAALEIVKIESGGRTAKMVMSWKDGRLLGVEAAYTLSK